MPEYTVSIVSYGTPGLAQAALFSAFTQSIPPAKIIVVENSQHTNHWKQWQGWAERVQSPVQPAPLKAPQGTTHDALSLSLGSLMDCHVLWSARNGGFCAGNNLALTHTHTPFFLSLNPDCLLETHAARRLLAAHTENVGVATGYLKASAEFGSTLDYAGAYVNRLTGRTRILRSPSPRGVSTRAFSFPIYAGGCALFSTGSLRSIGGFPEELFLYYDELLITNRLAKLGKRVTIIPDVVGTHARHATTRNADRTPSPLEAYHAARSALLAARDLGPFTFISWSAARFLWCLTLTLQDGSLAAASLRGMLSACRSPGEN